MINPGHILFGAKRRCVGGMLTLGSRRHLFTGLYPRPAGSVDLVSRRPHYRPVIVKPRNTRNTRKRGSILFPSGPYVPWFCPLPFVLYLPTCLLSTDYFCFHCLLTTSALTSVFLLSTVCFCLCVCIPEMKSISGQWHMNWRAGLLRDHPALGNTSSDSKMAK